MYHLLPYCVYIIILYDVNVKFLVELIIDINIQHEQRNQISNQKSIKEH